MVSSLLAGIHAPLVDGREGLMPESLARRANAADASGGCPASFRNGVRLHFGMMSGFASERCPASPRNPRPASIGFRTPGTPTPGKPPEPVHDPVPGAPPMHPPPQPERDPPPAPPEP